MPSHLLGDMATNGQDCGVSQKNNGLFPLINRNGSVESHNGTDSESPSDCSTSLNRSRSVSRSVSNATNRDSVLRLPSIDRSKTNSICSYASSNISSVTNSSRHQPGYKLSHSNMANPRYSQDFNSHDDVDRIESVTPQFHQEQHGNLHPGPRFKRTTNRPEEKGSDLKLPDIFSCKSSSIGSPIQSPSPTFRHHSRMSKKKSASLQDLAGQLRREESVLGDHKRNFNHSPNSCLTIENHGYHRNDTANSLTVRSSLPTPVLFPMRESESRLSRKSKSSVKRNKEKQQRRENDNMLKENDFKEVIEKLEAFSNVENGCDEKASLVIGKPNSLQKVREETEIDQYIYANGYDHPSKTRKSQKRAQSEDRRSAKVH